MKKINSLLPASLAAFVLIAGLVSCNDGVVQRQASAIDPPRDITSQNIAATQVTLGWDAVEGATGYSVAYGKTRDYGTTVETTEPSVVITGLEKDTTYYFSVRTKDGKAVSSLPKDIVITTQGGANTSDPTITGDEKPASAQERAQSFDSAVFAAEKAAWEAQNISDYQFVIRDYAGSPSYPATITVASNTVTNIKWDNEQDRPVLPYGQTVDAMYASIADKVAHTTEYRFSITYNATYHYPEYFSSSIIPPDGETGGGGYYFFEISSFEQSAADARAQPFDSAVFAAEKAAWEAQNISDYQFVIRSYAGGPSSPATITVASNTVTNIEGGQTIDEMYALIADSVANTSGAVYQITYNATYHYPEYFSCSIIDPDGEMLDGGWWFFEISSFELPLIE